MFEGWDAVTLARAQFAFTMSFHIVFPAFSIGLASYLAVLEARWLSTGREVAVLRDGRLVQTAAPAVLYRTPLDLDVARFVGEAVVVPGEARAGAVTCVLGTLAIRGERTDGAVQVMIRPEQIRLSPGGVAARVVGHGFYGAETELQLELSDDSGTAVVARTFDDGGVQIGDRTNVVVEGPVTVYPA